MTQVQKTKTVTLFMNDALALKEEDCKKSKQTKKKQEKFFFYFENP